MDTTRPASRCSGSSRSTSSRGVSPSAFPAGFALLRGDAVSVVRTRFTICAQERDGKMYSLLGEPVPARRTVRLPLGRARLRLGELRCGWAEGIATEPPNNPPPPRPPPPAATGKQKPYASSADRVQGVFARVLRLLLRLRLHPPSTMMDDEGLFAIPAAVNENVEIPLGLANSDVNERLADSYSKIAEAINGAFQLMEDQYARGTFVSIQNVITILDVLGTLHYHADVVINIIEAHHILEFHLPEEQVDALNYLGIDWAAMILPAAAAQEAEDHAGLAAQEAEDHAGLAAQEAENHAALAAQEAEDHAALPAQVAEDAALEAENDAALESENDAALESEDDAALESENDAALESEDEETDDEAVQGSGGNRISCSMITVISAAAVATAIFIWFLV